MGCKASKSQVMERYNYSSKVYGANNDKNKDLDIRDRSIFTNTSNDNNISSSRQNSLTNMSFRGEDAII